MAEDVEAGKIERAEGCALRAAQGRASDGVDFLDSVRAAGDLGQDAHHAVEADVIADEVG